MWRRARSASRPTPAVARLEPAAFLALVAQRWTIRELWVGHDFALGRGRSGDPAALRRLGQQHGWRLQVVPPLRLGGEIVSSTRIRRLLAARRLDEATCLLGAAGGDLGAAGGGLALAQSREPNTHREQ